MSIDGVVAPFLGQYAGGTGPAGLPDDGWYYGHKREQVLSTAERNAGAGGELPAQFNVALNGDLQKLGAFIEVVVEEVLQRAGEGAASSRRRPPAGAFSS